MFEHIHWPVLKWPQVAGFHVATEGISKDLPKAWSMNDLIQQWQAMANGCMHVIASDASGYAFSANQFDYCLQGQTTLTYGGFQNLSFDTASQRRKHLNWYYDFDLKTLLAIPRR